MTEYPRLKEAVMKEEQEHYFNASIALNKLTTEEEITQHIKWHDKKYKKNQKEKFIKFLQKRMHKRINEKFAQLDNAANAPDLPNDLIITVEWRASRMWGANPRAFTNYGFEGSSIGGCGYDKLSTATAQALNSNLSIMKALYTAKERMLETYKPLKNKDGSIYTEHDMTREVIGYGSGYSAIPSFEGGVGVSCHLSILKTIGFNAETVTSTKNVDVFRISTGALKC